MPGAGRAEIYFIAGMMILIMVLCTAAVIFFFKTYKTEMKQKAERLAKESEAAAAGTPIAEKKEGVEKA